MEQSLIESSISLLLYGMGTVFVFLIVAIVAITAMSHIINRFFPARVVEIPAAVSTPVAAEVEPHIVKAIQLALDKHRRREKK